MFTAGFILLIAGCCGLIQASDVETRSAPVAVSKLVNGVMTVVEFQSGAGDIQQIFTFK